MSEEDRQFPQKQYFVTRKRLSRGGSCRPSENMFQMPVQPEDEDTAQPTSSYHVLGDGDFKHKYLSEKMRASKTVDDIAAVPKSHANTTGHLQLMDTTGRLTIRNQSRLLQLSELNYLERDQKTFEQFATVHPFFMQMTDVWNKFDEKAAKKLRRPHKPSSNVRLFAQDNPQKDEIIKQIGLQYWQMSLRNNNKKLLKHLDSVPVAKCDFLRNMQTVKGREMLQKSIPKINRGTSEGFSLNGKRKAKRDLSETPSAQTPEMIQPEEVLRCTWRNKNLSRVHQQYAT